MAETVSVRKALPGDIGWVNAQYAAIDFKLSDYENEFIVIAEVGNQKAGIGRLQRIDADTAELGGIYVLDAYRGLGIANEIVRSLVDSSGEYRRVFCLPFEHLERFYAGFGFEPPDPSISIPSQVDEKHAWCNRQYPETTLLLVLER